MVVVLPSSRKPLFPAERNRSLGTLLWVRQFRYSIPRFNGERTIVGEKSKHDRRLILTSRTKGERGKQERAALRWKEREGATCSVLA